LSADFTEKKHFPPQLKPLYASCVSTAMDYNAFDSNFVKRMVTILPYNSFTLKKLASRLVYPDRLGNLKDSLTKMYDSFSKTIAASINESNEATVMHLVT
jgi:hypothetical protein